MGDTKAQQIFEVPVQVMDTSWPMLYIHIKVIHNLCTLQRIDKRIYYHHEPDSQNVLYINMKYLKGIEIGFNVIINSPSSVNKK
jgi:membrane protease subunit (stomatin/prohibitin family)